MKAKATIKGLKITIDPEKDRDLAAKTQIIIDGIQVQATITEATILLHPESMNDAKVRKAINENILDKL